MWKEVTRVLLQIYVCRCFVCIFITGTTVLLLAIMCISYRGQMCFERLLCVIVFAVFFLVHLAIHWNGQQFLPY